MTDVVVDFDKLSPAGVNAATCKRFLTTTDAPVLQHALSFLDAKTLTAVCATGHKPLARLAAANELWKAHLQRDFPAVNANSILNSRRNMKRLYLDKVQDRHQAALDAAAAIAQEESERQWEKYTNVGRGICYVAEACTPLMCIPAALIIFTALLSVYVDFGSVSINSLFIPLYVVFAIMGCLFVTYVCEWVDTRTFCVPKNSCMRHCRLATHLGQCLVAALSPPASPVSCDRARSAGDCIARCKARSSTFASRSFSGRKRGAATLPPRLPLSVCC